MVLLAMENSEIPNFREIFQKTPSFVLMMRRGGYIIHAYVGRLSVTRLVKQTKKGLNMKNKNVVKSITPELLQEIFLDYANALCAEELRTTREVSLYKEHSKEAYEENRCWFQALSGWVDNIKAGKILRVLKFVGAYDGHKIDNDRLLTALRTLCYIARFDDGIDGKLFAFEGCLYEIPYDYLYRFERFVRTAV